MSQAGDMMFWSLLPPASEAQTMTIMARLMMSMPRKILTGVEGSLPRAVQPAEEGEEERGQGEDEERLEELIGLGPEPFQDDRRALGEEGQAEEVLVEGDPEEDDDEEEDDEGGDALALFSLIHGRAGGRGGGPHPAAASRRGLSSCPAAGNRRCEAALAGLEDDQGEDHARGGDPEGEVVAVEDGAVDRGHERGDHGPQVDAHVEDVEAGVLEVGPCRRRGSRRGRPC